MGRKKTSIAKFKTTPVTKIEFFVKGTSEKQINKIIIVLKNLGVGSVEFSNTGFLSTHNYPIKIIILKCVGKFGYKNKKKLESIVF